MSWFTWTSLATLLDASPSLSWGWDTAWVTRRKVNSKASEPVIRGARSKHHSFSSRGNTQPSRRPVSRFHRAFSTVLSGSRQRRRVVRNMIPAADANDKENSSVVSMVHPGDLKCSSIEKTGSSRQPHELEIGGSSPPTAIIFLWIRSRL